MHSVSQTADGGYVLGGLSWSGVSTNKSDPSYGFGDYLVVKLDASGNKQWDKTFGGSDTDELTSLQQTADGGFILGGWSWSGVSGNKTTANIGVSSFWVIKLDPPPSLSLSAVGKTNGFNAFRLSGPAGSYSIRASTNFVNWVPLTSITLDGTNATVFVDTQSTNYPSRYYRAVGQ